MKKFIPFTIILVVVSVLASLSIYGYSNYAESKNSYSLNESAKLLRPSQATAKKHKWFLSIVTPAQEAQKKYGVPASISLAQAITESDWGQSELSQEHHNLFGIKDKNGKPFKTKEYVNGKWITITDKFATYNSDGESVIRHAMLIKNGTSENKDRYKKVVTAKNYKDAAKALQDGGYATDPDYAEKLISVIQSYDLQTYDE